MAFLPITVEEVEERGWDEIDFDRGRDYNILML